MGALAVQMKQPATGLPYFITALNADPSRGLYWLSYIDALLEDGQPEEARQVLALARQHGLEGDDVEALALRLNGGTQIAAQPAAESPQISGGSLPTAPVAPRSSQKPVKTKHTKGKSAGKFTSPKGKEPSPQEVNTLVTLFNKGRLAEAAAQAQAMTMRFPLNWFGWKMLGVLFQQMGQNADALAPMQKAAALLPGDAEMHNNLGIVLQELCRLGEAEASYRRALQIRPDYAEAHNNLGSAFQDMGRLDEAEASYRRALQIKPDYAEAHYNLGVTLKKLNRLGEAEASYRRTLEIKPDLAEAHNNLGAALKELGRLDEAEVCFRRALQVSPDFANAHNNLGTILKDLGRLDEAAVCFRRALQVKPDFAEAHYNLGITLHGLGRLDEAKASYRKAYQLGFYAARIKEALMLPAIMGTRQEVLESRAEFERNLDELIADKIILDNPLTSFGMTNFYLAFHGLNDRDLQVKVAKYCEQACPSLLYTAPYCTKPIPDAQKKLRVGFLSKYLYNHSVSLCFSKIIETLSLKEQFEVALISNGPIDEKIYSGFAGRRVRLQNNLVRAREMVAALELDILVYLDIGMEPLSYFMAFSRLARVQCVMGGHPVTTGIANMDYFLSSDLLEPAGADKHYSEKLIRLPLVGVFYFKRPALPAAFKTRGELGLPEARRIYMCPVKLQKIHPDFDEAITRILQIDNNGAVVFFEDDKHPSWKAMLAKRLEKTMPEDVRERILFLPWINEYTDFISANAAADVVLDPFHFGLGSTIITTFAVGTPLVTKPGEFLRGRAGMGLCNIMDLHECIAEDTEAYAQKAVQIASNRTLRDTISAKILKNNHVLFENMQPVVTLADFFCSLTDRSAKQP